MTPHPITWRSRVFTFGLIAAACSWLLLTVDVLLSLSYGWHQSVLLAVLNGDPLWQIALLWWVCLVVISLHARD